MRSGILDQTQYHSEVCTNATFSGLTSPSRPPLDNSQTVAKTAAMAVVATVIVIPVANLYFFLPLASTSD